MTQPKRGSTSAPKPSDGLEFTEAAWPTKTGGIEVPEPILTKLRESWADARPVNGRLVGKPFALTCQGESAKRLRERQLRAAGKTLSLGVSIKIDKDGETFRLTFRARQPRSPVPAPSE